MNKPKTVQVRISEAMDKWLARKAKSADESRCFVIREIIREVMANDK